MNHTPVLVKEVLQFLESSANQDFIDCNVGFGGHAEQILSNTKPKGRVLGIDLDEQTIKQAQSNLKKFANRVILVNDNFVNIAEIAKNNGFLEISGIIFDLGLSSWQIDQSKRGFTFMRDEPLDMRFGQTDLTAEKIINKYTPKNLANVFYQYGDIGYSRSLANKIYTAREHHTIHSTVELVEAIGTKNPKILAPIWQALRIEVNDELNFLQNALVKSIDLLKIGGRVAVISFHSGEDRIVKNLFRDMKISSSLKILTKKPITASEQEISQNSRARSAKMRVAERI